jgi:short-subunit dehydrogenase/SAM-dependent methyltransferase
MIDWRLARRYQAAGMGLGGILLKQSLYPRPALLAALEGADVVLDLGCGEGLLTNLLARALPRTRFIGTDLAQEKIQLALTCRTGSNVDFTAGDLFQTTQAGASGLIFNDVLHHLPPVEQEQAMALAARCLDGSGVLILKEVAATDALDKAHTSFWDNRLYPQDRLHFRTIPEWIALAGRHGFRLLDTSIVRHPWIASRSVLIFTQRPRVPLPRTEPATETPSARRVLLTGGTGFIGEHVLRELMEHGLAGQPVEIGLVTRRPWAVPAMVRADRRIRIIEADLARPLAPGKLSGHWDYVFHLAAEVDYFGGAGTYRNNLDGTAHLLQALHGMPVQRFFFASTMGAVDRSRFDNCSQPLREKSNAHPTSPYGRAKIAEEALVQKSGLPFTIVRIPWCYGPGMSRSHHVRHLLAQVRRNSLPLRFDWPGRVSLVSVGAAAKLFITSAHAETASGQVFFISDGHPLSFGELFRAMGAATGNTSAGQWRLPRPLVWLARQLHFVLPFQAKALLCDALTVSNERARELGMGSPDRPGYFLQSLARFDAGENWPSRWRQAALVTGAAGGIGRALAELIHTRGYALCLVDRDEAALALLAGRLGAHFRVIDLASVDCDQVVAQLAGDQAARVGLVVNNAGLGFRGGYADLDSAKLETMLAVNIRALLFATTGFSREMTRRGGGIIVNIASTAAFQPLPYMAAYAASKAFVLSFTLAAAAEQKPAAKVHLLAFSPSGTGTNFQKVGGVAVSSREKLLTPQAVAAQILHAVEKKKTSSIGGLRGFGMAAYARLVPMRLLVATWELLMRRAR